MWAMVQTDSRETCRRPMNRLAEGPRAGPEQVRAVFYSLVGASRRSERFCGSVPPQLAEVPSRRAGQRSDLVSGSEDGREKRGDERDMSYRTLAVECHDSESPCRRAYPSHGPDLALYVLPDCSRWPQPGPTACRQGQTAVHPSEGRRGME